MTTVSIDSPKSNPAKSDPAKSPVKLLYIVTHAPYSNAQGQEALDAILIGASFEQQVSVLFVHDGVFQIKSAQNSEGSSLKMFTKTYKALADFGVEKAYVHNLSLVARGLSQSDLSINTQQLNSDQLTDLIAQQDRVFTF